MLSYIHELSYKPMICSSPSSPLTLSISTKITYKYDEVIYKLQIKLQITHLLEKILLPKIINTWFRNVHDHSWFMNINNPITNIRSIFFLT